MRKLLRYLAPLAVFGIVVFIPTRISQPTTASAHIPHPGLLFHIEVPGVAGCTTASGDATCQIRSDATFPVVIHLDNLGGVANYSGFDIIMHYEGVGAQAGYANVTSHWRECQIPASNYDVENTVALACAIGLPPSTPSTYTGDIAETAFTCSGNGNVELLHGEGNTDIVSESGDTTEAHSEPGDGETLNIQCTSGGQVPPTPQGPGPPSHLQQTAAAENGTFLPTDEDETPAQNQTPETPSTSETGTGTPSTAEATPATSDNDDDDDGGGLPVWAWIIIGVAGVGAAGGLGYAGWRWYQGRGAGSPPTP